MIFLPDVNIWIALTSNRHVHHGVATTWLQNVDADAIAFCRVTGLGFLRLLTNAHVMGNDVSSPQQAWQVYDEWRSDDRVVFLHEQANFGEHWRQAGTKMKGGVNIWTDAYLAAFAVHNSAIVVTLDRSFLNLGDGRTKSLL